VIAQGIDLDPWWDEPAYRAAMGTFSERGAFILGKLRLHDGARLQTVLADVYCGKQPDPADITKFEWQVILSYLGTNTQEIADVQMRMGRRW
jgi:hypothetical protein